MSTPAPDAAAPVAVVLVSPRRVELPATARWTVVPSWRRGLLAGGVLALGAVAAVPAVAVPPHFVVSLGLLGVASLGAYAIWSRAEFVDDVAFTCTCGEAVQVGGIGQWTPDTWVRCPACAAPWRVGPRPGA